MSEYPRHAQRATKKPHDLGDDAVILWRMRLQAEADALGAIAADPATASPLAIRLGCKARHFTLPQHRAVFLVLTEHCDVGPVECCRLAIDATEPLGIDPNDTVDLFERFPPSITHATFRVKRLLKLAALLTEAQQYLAHARRLVASGVAAMAAEGVAA